MKRKICFAMLTLGGSLMVFAADPKAAPKADPCTEKYNSCNDSCSNVLARCKAGGSIPENCESRFKQCTNDCIKAKNDCEKKK